MTMRNMSSVGIDCHGTIGVLANGGMFSPSLGVLGPRFEPLMIQVALPLSLEEALTLEQGFCLPEYSCRLQVLISFVLLSCP